MLDAPLRLRDGEPGPPDEVTDGRGPVAGEVARGQLGARVARCARLRAGSALVEERVGELAAARGPAAHHLFELGVNGQDAESRTSCRDAVLRQRRRELASCAKSPAGEL